MPPPVQLLYIKHGRIIKIEEVFTVKSLLPKIFPEKYSDKSSWLPDNRVFSTKHEFQYKENRR